MNILIGCEVSGVIRNAYRERGYNAWSCDLQPADDKSPYHFYGDVKGVVDPLTGIHESRYGKWRWDLGIFHPECRYLSNSGVHCLVGKNKSDEYKRDRWQKMVDAALFFKWCLDLNIEKICVENPVIHGYAKKIIGRGPDQTIQPYDFGENASKRTCYWLKGLPPLIGTEYFPPEYGCKYCLIKFDLSLGKYGCPGCGADFGPAKYVWGNQTPSGQNKLGPSSDRAKKRAETYPGVAKAKAIQWGVL